MRSIRLHGLACDQYKDGTLGQVVVKIPCGP